MQIKTAIKILTACAERDMRRLHFDANLHDEKKQMTPRAISAAKERMRIRQAIETLNNLPPDV